MDEERTSRATTFSCERRQPLLACDVRKDHFVACLKHLATNTTAEVHAWVVMRNHVHLLWTPRQERVNTWLARLKRRFVELLPAASLPHAGRFWQRGGGYDRRVWSHEEWLRQLRYIEANPVRARIATSETDYRWSSSYDWRVAQRAWTPKLSEAPEGLQYLWWY
jgi:putative transposase